MKNIGLLILGVIGLLVVANIIESIKRKRVPKKSTDSLKAMFAKRSNFTGFHQAALELKRRGEDISFTFPVFLDMALSSGVQGMIGRGCLQTHFGDKLSGIDLSEKNLSGESRRKLNELQEQVEKLTST